MHMNPATDHPQAIDPDRRGSGLTFYATVSNIETGAVQGANQAIRPQATILQLRQRVRAFVLDGEEFILSVTDQNVVAGYLEGLAAAIRYFCDIDQISKTAVFQLGFPGAGIERIS